MVCPKKMASGADALSESVQMYLVSIARLREDDEPVPLSQLAEALSVSPVSVNEMCRKLEGQGLVDYQPYKGVSLTIEGGRYARYILRRHRLWEVFLVDKLGFGFDEAHEVACQLEHTTPDLLTRRLDAFLGHPQANHLGQPIPGVDGRLPERVLSPLTALPAGQSGHVVRCDITDTVSAFLDEQGLRPGAAVTVLATGKDSLLVQIGTAQLSLARMVAEAIRVEVPTMDT